MADPPPHLKGIGLALSGVALLSPDSLLVRLIHADTWTLLFWRGLLMAAGLTVSIALRNPNRILRAFRHIGRPGILAGALFSGSTICFVLAVTHTTVANTLIIIGVGPLFAALLSRIFLHEHIALRTCLATLAALAGIGITVSENLQQGVWLGDLCALGTAACMGGHVCVVRFASRVDMTPSVVLGGLIAAAVVSPWARPHTVWPHDASILLLLGLIVLPLAFGLLTLAPRYLPAPEVSLLMLLLVVLGPAWVWLVLGEQPGTRAFIGGPIVLGALAIHSALALKAPRPPAD